MFAFIMHGTGDSRYCFVDLILLQILKLDLDPSKGLRLYFSIVVF